MPMSKLIDWLLSGILDRLDVIESTQQSIMGDVMALTDDLNAFSAKVDELVASLAASNQAIVQILQDLRAAMAGAASEADVKAVLDTAVGKLQPVVDALAQTAVS